MSRLAWGSSTPTRSIRRPRTVRLPRVFVRSTHPPRAWMSWTSCQGSSWISACLSGESAVRGSRRR